MSKRHPSEIVTCANCGAGFTRKSMAGGIVIDERTENYFCDRQCFGEWADFTQVAVEYYAEYNLREVDEL